MSDTLQETSVQELLQAALQTEMRRQMLQALPDEERLTQLAAVTQRWNELSVEQRWAALQASSQQREGKEVSPEALEHASWGRLMNDLEEAQETIQLQRWARNEALGGLALGYSQ